MELNWKKVILFHIPLEQVIILEQKLVVCWLESIRNCTHKANKWKLSKLDGDFWASLILQISACPWYPDFLSFVQLQKAFMGTLRLKIYSWRWCQPCKIMECLFSMDWENTMSMPFKHSGILYKRYFSFWKLSKHLVSAHRKEAPSCLQDALSVEMEDGSQRFDSKTRKK